MWTVASPLLLLAVSAAPVAAHHGWSGYDSTKELTLTGTIKEPDTSIPTDTCASRCPARSGSSCSRRRRA